MEQKQHVILIGKANLIIEFLSYCQGRKNEKEQNISVYLYILLFKVFSISTAILLIDLQVKKCKEFLYIIFNSFSEL
jgi:hypothetical protein